MRWCSSTRATSPSRSSAACSAATSAARRRWPNTASACRRAWTTGRCGSRNGTPCARRPWRVSATPGSWEIEQAHGIFAEQVIRPTGLIDPPVEVRPARTQVDDLVGEVRQVAQRGYRALRHRADQAHGRGPHRIPARAGHPRALHALRHRHASSASRSSATCASAPSTRWSASTCCARASTFRNARWSRSSTPTRKDSCAARPRSFRPSAAPPATSTAASSSTPTP